MRTIRRYVLGSSSLSGHLSIIDKYFFFSITILSKPLGTSKDHSLKHTTNQTIARSDGKLECHSLSRSTKHAKSETLNQRVADPIEDLGRIVPCGLFIGTNGIQNPPYLG